MRRRITGQDSDMHPDALAGQTHEPFHRRTDEVGAARRSINVGADAATHRPALGILVVAVKTGVMVLVFFEHGETSVRRGVPALAGGNRTVDCDLFSRHEVSALFGERNDHVRVLGCDLLQD